MSLTPPSCMCTSGSPGRPRVQWGSRKGGRLVGQGYPPPVRPRAVKFTHPPKRVNKWYGLGAGPRVGTGCWSPCWARQSILRLLHISVGAPLRSWQTATHVAAPGILIIGGLAGRSARPREAQGGAWETKGPTEEVSPHRFPLSTPPPFLERRGAVGELGLWVVGGRDSTKLEG